MKTSISITRTILSLSVMACISGCGQTTASAPAESAVNQNDLNFITTLYNIDEFDRQMAGVEIARGTDPRVRTLAIEILTHADAFRQKVKPISDAAGISPPTVLTFGQNDPQTSIANLIAGPRDYVDGTFIYEEIAAHKEALARRDALATQPGGNEQLKVLAAAGAANLRVNLDKLEALQKDHPKVAAHHPRAVL